MSETVESISETLGTVSETVGTLSETVGTISETVGMVSETVGKVSETVANYSNKHIISILTFLAEQQPKARKREREPKNTTIVKTDQNLTK